MKGNAMKQIKPTILIVDDEEIVVEHLVTILHNDYILKVAYNGAQALEILHGYIHIDMVLLDITMPDIDGFHVAQLLLDDPKTNSIPFIFLTGHNEIDIIKKAFGSGAKDYITKPINPEELFIRIKTQLKTSQLQLELSNQKKEFETIFNFAADGIAKIDLDGNFLTCNDAFCKLLDYTKEEMTTKNCQQLTSYEYRSKNKSIIEEVINTGKVLNIEKECDINNGTKIFVNMSMSLLPDKQSIVLIVKNTTTIKLDEQKLRLQSLNEMMTNIAHQWRQPLGIISVCAGGLELRATNHMELSNEHIIESSDKIIDQTKYLSKIIDQFTGFVNNRTDFETVILSDLINYTTQLINPTLELKNTTIIKQIEEDFFIKANKNEIAQVLMNIITNSLEKFSQSSQIEEKLIIISCKKSDDNKIVIDIQDNGGGIDESIKNRIFEPYFTTKHQAIGTGLGLSLANDIIRHKYKGSVEACNTDFEYANKKYIGALFQIYLPLN
jgi:PAS domain S-box-containing protein